MVCMKCGSKMETEQAFCQDCLLEMEKYPVKPGTAVHLPIRKETPTVHKKAVHRRRTVSPEEQIAKLKKRVWILGISLFLSLALVVALAHPAANYFIRKYHLRPGQTYSTITPSTAAAEPDETTAATEITEVTADPWEGFAD